jgi:hypothetical protein
MALSEAACTRTVVMRDRRTVSCRPRCRPPTRIRRYGAAAPVRRAPGASRPAPHRVLLAFGGGKDSAYTEAFAGVSQSLCAVDEGRRGEGQLCRPVERLRLVGRRGVGRTRGGAVAGRDLRIAGGGDLPPPPLPCRPVAAASGDERQRHRERGQPATARHAREHGRPEQGRPCEIATVRPTRPVPQVAAKVATARSTGAHRALGSAYADLHLHGCVQSAHGSPRISGVGMNWAAVTSHAKQAVGLCKNGTGCSAHAVALIGRARGGRP